MLKDLLIHGKETEKLLKNPPAKVNWKKEYAEFSKHIENLQYERLIHLMVTLTIGLVLFVNCLTILFLPQPILFILGLLLLCLFIPYLIHYRKLENTTQYWYELSNKLKKKAS